MLGGCNATADSPLRERMRRDRDSRIKVLLFDAGKSDRCDVLLFSEILAAVSREILTFGLSSVLSLSGGVVESESKILMTVCV